MKTNVVINLQVAGVHQWKGCNISNVLFLANKHRHVFYVKCKKKVTHNDRDIEIIMLKEAVEKYLLSKYGITGRNICDFGNNSCEMLAEELVKEFSLNYCSVLEDNENGAEVVK